MLSCPSRWLVLLPLAFCVPAQAATTVRDAEYIHGYAQGIIDHQFPSLNAQTRGGSELGNIIVSVPSCLDTEKRLAISKALLGPIVTKVDLEMPCPSEPITEKEVSPTAAATAGGQTTESSAGEIIKEVKVEPLPSAPLFRSLLADPREPRFSLSYQRHKSGKDHFNAGDVTAGTYFGFAEGKYRDNQYQVGIQGAVFALFDLDAPSHDLLNADYWVGFPLSWRHSEWSGRVRLYHQSSHLGDEFLLRNPGFKRVNLSYEVLDGQLSREWTHLRLYGGTGIILHSEPNLHRGMAQLGAEYQVGTIVDGVDITLASDFKASDEQNWNINQSYRAGFTFTRINRDVRLLLEYYHGYSPNGQFFLDRLEYTGVGLYFGL